MIWWWSWKGDFWGFEIWKPLGIFLELLRGFFPNHENYKKVIHDLSPNIPNTVEKIQV
jgi:hypothetical protein